MMTRNRRSPTVRMLLYYWREGDPLPIFCMGMMAVVLLMFLLTGCGGGGSVEEPSPEPAASAPGYANTQPVDCQAHPTECE